MGCIDGKISSWMVCFCALCSVISANSDFSFSVMRCGVVDIIALRMKHLEEPVARMPLFNFKEKAVAESWTVSTDEMIGGITITTTVCHPFILT